MKTISMLEIKFAKLLCYNLWNILEHNRKFFGQKHNRQFEKHDRPIATYSESQMPTTQRKGVD